MADPFSSNHAPVAMFVYGRPDHARQTLQALARNNGAGETDLIVFADGARGPADRGRVAATRAVIREFAVSGAFRSVELIERPENFGLTRNISEGVSDAVARRGRVIVLEDDTVPAAGFLDYMNAALEKYEANPRVWHISGWNFPIDPEGMQPFFFWQVMNCWGWATWVDRWNHYERDPERILKEWPSAKRRAFNLDGAYDYVYLVAADNAGRINTWDVYWYATIFERGGLCLNPAQPFVRNIGFDGSGEHCDQGPEQSLDLDRRFEGGLPDETAPSEEMTARIRAHLIEPIHRRLIGRIWLFRRLRISKRVRGALQRVGLS